MRTHLPDQHHLFSQPDWFLAGLDIESNRFSYLRTSRDLIQNTAFHDGRAELSLDGALEYASVDAALAWQAEQSAGSGVNRLVVHTSFCGSTLLSRALGGLPGCVAYREPQVLIELANLKANGHPSYVQRDRWKHLLQFVLGQFRKVWAGDNVACIKPSNWTNNLLAELVSLDQRSHVVMISLDLDAYLVANIRGGKPRIGYSLNLLNHLVTERPHYRSTVAGVEAETLSPMGRMLRLLSICYQIQATIMAESENSMSAADSLKLQKNEIVRQPAASVLRAAQVLRMPVESEDVEIAVSSVYKFDSKASSSAAWHPTAETTANEQIIAQFSEELAATRAWYSEFLEIRVQSA